MASRRRSRISQRGERATLLARVLLDYGAALMRWALFNSSYAQDADDAIGDAAVQFMLHFAGGDIEEARRWMIVVVKQCAWEISRTRRRRGVVVKEVPLDAEGTRLQGAEGDLRDPSRLVDVVGELTPALTRLRPDETRALLLVAAGYKLAEIASIQGWTYTKVKRCVYEGRQGLREILREGGEEH